LLVGTKLGTVDGALLIADKNCNLLFPTAGCKPNTHFLEYLKDVAKRAKLEPDNFWLHKFRATFATWHLWKGVDLRTVQDWMGHTENDEVLEAQPQQGRAAEGERDFCWAYLSPAAGSAGLGTLKRALLLTRENELRTARHLDPRAPG
jgi:hypothetical protein